VGVQSPAPLTHSSHSLRLLRKEQKTDARDEWLNYLSTKPGQAHCCASGSEAKLLERIRFTIDIN